MSPTPIEWADETDRMQNINLHVGCPHGRLGRCGSCDLLNEEAQAVWDDDGGYDSGSVVPEGGEFDDASR